MPAVLAATKPMMYGREM